MNNKPLYTPMIEQYLKIKSKYKDSLLLYRLGDFYELFFDDAKKASKLLDIVLTQRGKTEQNPVPMAGIPFRSLENYLYKLLESGLKIVICEQIGEIKKIGIMDRKVTRVITPGTASEENLIEAHENYILMSILFSNKYVGIAYLEYTKGLIKILELPNDKSLIKDYLQKLKVKEIIILNNQKHLLKHILEKNVYSVYKEEWDFQLLKAEKNIEKYFGLFYLTKELKKQKIALSATGALINYIMSLNENFPKHIYSISLENNKKSLNISVDDRKSLEIDFNPNSDKTLFNIMNNCKTYLGIRLLKDWFTYPIRDTLILLDRQNAIKDLKKNNIFKEIQTLLCQTYDIERILSRISLNTNTPKDLIFLHKTLLNLAKIKMKQQFFFHKSYIFKLLEKIFIPYKIIELLKESILDNPANNVNDGYIIKSEYDNKLYELRNINIKVSLSILKIEKQEKNNLKISNLKIKYNKIYGYHIIITKNKINNIPKNYIKIQTLKNQERFITEELKNLENQVISSKIKALEYEKYLYKEIINKILLEYKSLQITAQCLAEIDVLTNLSERSIKLNLTCPIFTNKDCIKIKKGRHLVIENKFDFISFVSNSLNMTKNKKFHIITGPNMGGKSTYMRQIAQIVFLSYIGSFVPAEDVLLCDIDHIFTRIGASDDISSGRSTFMVEMTECAYIIRHATQKSLIIMDEIGRGTSTSDGLSISIACAEKLIILNSFVLFASHYLEITKLESYYSNVKNIHFSATETSNKIIFLHNIEEGPAIKSYGIQVAQLAGIPLDVIQNANNILNKKKHFSCIKNQNLITSNDVIDKKLSLLGNIVNELKTCNIDLYTQKQAINKLHFLKNLCLKKNIN